MRKLFVSAAAVLCAAGIAFAEDVKSGLECGSSPDAFNVRDVTGPSKGDTLCYRCKYGSRPVVTIFTREVNEEVGKLVKQIDDVVAKNKDKKMAAFVVLLTDNPDAAEPKLAELAKKNQIKNVPLTIYDGEAGPPSYNISKDAALNVMMWVKSDVKVNQAFAKANIAQEDSAKLVKETAKILN